MIGLSLERLVLPDLGKSDVKVSERWPLTGRGCRRFLDGEDPSTCAAFGGIGGSSAENVVVVLKLGMLMPKSFFFGLFCSFCSTCCCVELAQPLSFSERGTNEH